MHGIDCCFCKHTKGGGGGGGVVPRWAHPLHIPMVPAGPHHCDCDIGGGPRSRPVQLSIMAAALLFVSYPYTLAHTTRTHSRPTCCWNPPAAPIGGRGRAPAPLQARSATPRRGEGRRLRVWAPSPPMTTDWAAYGRQVMGAWSVATYPAPMLNTTPTGGARACTYTLYPFGPAPGNVPESEHATGFSERVKGRAPIAGKRPVAGTRPYAVWLVAYPADRVPAAGHGALSSRTVQRSGVAAHRR